MLFPFRCWLQNQVGRGSPTSSDSGPKSPNALLELTWAQMLAILLFVPGLAASSIAEEDRRGTMTELLASPLSGAAIILGKLGGPLLHTAIILLVGLPLVVPALLFGLIEPLQVARAWFMLAVLAMFLASLALMAAAVVRRPRSAIPTAYILVAAWVFIPIWLTPAVRGLHGPWAWVKTINEWVLFEPPFGSGSDFRSHGPGFTGDPSTDIGWVWLGLSRLYVEPTGRGLIWWGLPRTLMRVVVPQSVAALSCLVVAVLCLRARRLGLADGKRRGWLTEPGIAGPKRNRVRSLVTTRCCGRRAAATGLRGRTRGPNWDRTAIRGNAGSSLRADAPAFSEWTTSWVEIGTANGRRWQLNESLRSLLTVLYFVGLLAASSVAAASVAGERERGSWTALLASPLTGWEIARAKVLGVLWKCVAGPPVRSYLGHLGR